MNVFAAIAHCAALVDVFVWILDVLSMTSEIVTNASTPRIVSHIDINDLGVRPVIHTVNDCLGISPATIWDAVVSFVV